MLPRDYVGSQPTFITSKDLEGKYSISVAGRDAVINRFGDIIDKTGQYKGRITHDKRTGQVKMDPFAKYPPWYWELSSRPGNWTAIRRGGKTEVKEVAEARKSVSVLERMPDEDDAISVGDSAADSGTESESEAEEALAALEPQVPALGSPQPLINPKTAKILHDFHTSYPFIHPLESRSPPRGG